MNAKEKGEIRFHKKMEGWAIGQVEKAITLARDLAAKVKEIGDNSDIVPDRYTIQRLYVEWVKACAEACGCLMDAMSTLVVVEKERRESNPRSC